MTVTFLGYYDCKKSYKFLEGSAPVELVLLKLCHKKRKETPYMMETVGMVEVPCNPSEDHPPNKAPTISVPAESLTTSNGQPVSQKSIPFTFFYFNLAEFSSLLCVSHVLVAEMFSLNVSSQLLADVASFVCYRHLQVAILYNFCRIKLLTSGHFYSYKVVGKRDKLSSKIAWCGHIMIAVPPGSMSCFSQHSLGYDACKCSNNLFVVSDQASFHPVQSPDQRLRPVSAEPPERPDRREHRTVEQTPEVLSDRKLRRLFNNDDDSDDVNDDDDQCLERLGHNDHHHPQLGTQSLR